MYESESTKRVQMIARVALVWAAILVVRLIHLQIISHGEFVRLAQQQHAGDENDGRQNDGKLQ